MSPTTMPAPSRAMYLKRTAPAGIALDEPGRPRPLHHGADGGGRIVEQLHHGGARPHAHHPAHQPVGHDHRGLGGDALPRAAVHGERAHPAAALARDHLAGQRGHGQALAQAEEAAQPVVLLAGLRDLEGLHAEPLVLGAELLVLAPRRAPLAVADPEGHRAAMDLGQDDLGGRGEDGQDVGGPAGPPAAGLHGEEHQADEEHRDEETIPTKFHRGSPRWRPAEPALRGADPRPGSPPSSGGPARPEPCRCPARRRTADRRPR